MDAYVSTIDGHRHFGAQARNECAICGVQDERDELRSVVLDAHTALVVAMPDDTTATSIADAVRKLTAERDRLRAMLAARRDHDGEPDDE